MCMRLSWSVIRMSSTTCLSSSSLFQSLLSPQLSRLEEIFGKRNIEIRIAGGAVRDILSGIQPKDVDFATPATPEEMKRIFEAENIRMINALGERHGTITVRLDDKENFELTTLRIDKVTDGRHAEVEFTTDWKLDANRRDLTINSMFMDLKGNVYDFFGGEKDLKARRVVFVGDPQKRIQEDFLRILRYFRFHGRIASSKDGHEESTLKAIEENAHGLQGISGERIWMEWKKILSGNNGVDLTLKMLSCGLSQYIGLPSKEDQRPWSELEALRSKQKMLHPVTLITTLLRNQDQMLKLHGRLKLSAFERDLGLFVIDHRNDDGDQIPHLKEKHWRDILVDTKNGVNNCRQFILEVLTLRDDEELANSIREWEVPRFPVGGQDLMQLGCPKGKFMGVVLNRLRETWKASNFSMDRETLLSDLPAVIDELRLTKGELLTTKRGKSKERKNSLSEPLK